MTTAIVVPAGVTGAGGYVSPGAQFAVYANVTDPGNPPSGVARSWRTCRRCPGATAVPITPCVTACTVGGVTFAYVSTSVTADNSLTAGDKSYTVDALDNAGNNSGPLPETATVQTTTPSITASTVAPISTGTAGWVAQGGAYAVYASVTDASGLSSLTANVSSITAEAPPRPRPLLQRVYRRRRHLRVQERHADRRLLAARGLRNAHLLPRRLGQCRTAGNAYRLLRIGRRHAGERSPRPQSPPARRPPPAWVKQGGSYRIYANASDALSGMSTVTANVSGVTSGQTAVSLPVCTSSCAVGGVTYGYKSARADGNRTAGGGERVLHRHGLTDKAGNVTNQGYSVSVDNTPAAVTASVIARPRPTPPGGWRRAATTGCTPMSPTPEAGSRPDRGRQLADQRPDRPGARRHAPAAAP